VLLPRPGHRPDHLAVWLHNIRHLITADAAESPCPYVTEASDWPVRVDSRKPLDALQAQGVLPAMGAQPLGPSWPGNLRSFATIHEQCQHAIAPNTLPTDGAARAAG